MARHCAVSSGALYWCGIYIWKGARRVQQSKCWVGALGRLLRLSDVLCGRENDTRACVLTSSCPHGAGNVMASAPLSHVEPSSSLVDSDVRSCCGAYSTTL
eukprot:1730981-Pyramimonas_sp.AAC.2